MEAKRVHNNFPLLFFLLVAIVLAEHIDRLDECQPFEWKTRHTGKRTFQTHCAKNGKHISLVVNIYSRRRRRRRTQKHRKAKKTFSISNDRTRTRLCAKRARTFTISKWENVNGNCNVTSRRWHEEDDWLMLFIRLLNSTVCCTMGVIKLMVSMNSLLTIRHDIVRCE